MSSSSHTTTMAFSAYTEVKFCKAYTYDIETVAIDGKQRKMTIPEGTIATVAASTKTQTFPTKFKYTLTCQELSLGLITDVPDEYIEMTGV